MCRERLADAGRRLGVFATSAKFPPAPAPSNLVAADNLHRLGIALTCGGFVPASSWFSWSGANYCGIAVGRNALLDRGAHEAGIRPISPMRSGNSGDAAHDFIRDVFGGRVTPV